MNPMLVSVLNRVVLILSGMLFSDGLATDDELKTFGSAVATIVTLAWSLYRRYRDYEDAKKKKDQPAGV